MKTSKKLFFGVLAIISVPVVIAAGYGYFQEKSAQKDYSAFSKTIHEIVSLTTPINQNVTDSMNQCALSKSLDGPAQTMDATISNAQTELTQINQNLVQTVIPTSFNETEQSNAKKVLSNYQKATEANLKATETARASIKAKIKGDMALSGRLTEDSNQYYAIAKSYEHEANNYLALIRTELGLPEDPPDR